MGVGERRRQIGALPALNVSMELTGKQYKFALSRVQYKMSAEKGEITKYNRDNK